MEPADRERIEAIQRHRDNDWDADWDDVEWLLSQLSALTEALTQRTCPQHTDPLVCLACEAEEDARPEWQKPHRVTPPRLRGEPERTDVERLRQQAIFVSEMLHHAGIGPCTITEGVRALTEALSAAREEIARLKSEDDVRDFARGGTMEIYPRHLTAAEDEGL